jgi:hypothetical protein
VIESTLAILTYVVGALAAAFVLVVYGDFRKRRDPEYVMSEWLPGMVVTLWPLTLAITLAWLIGSAILWPFYKFYVCRRASREAGEVIRTWPGR